MMCLILSIRFVHLSNNKFCTIDKHSISAHLFIGAAIMFAQFDINQFRAIVWFNVAAGVAFIVLQLLMFHGEVGWNYKMRKQCAFTKADRFWNSPFELFISFDKINLKVTSMHYFSLVGCP